MPHITLLDSGSTPFMKIDIERVGTLVIARCGLTDLMSTDVAYSAI